MLVNGDTLEVAVYKIRWGDSKSWRNVESGTTVKHFPAPSSSWTKRGRDPHFGLFLFIPMLDNSPSAYSHSAALDVLRVHFFFHQRGLQQEHPGLSGTAEHMHDYHRYSRWAWPHISTAVVITGIFDLFIGHDECLRDGHASGCPTNQPSLCVCVCYSGFMKAIVKQCASRATCNGAASAASVDANGNGNRVDCCNYNMCNYSGAESIHMHTMMLMLLTACVLVL